MGNTNSRFIEVGRKLEDAIRFNVSRVTFDGDVSKELEKVRPEIEKVNYSIYWTVERILDPFSGTITETHFNTPSINGYGNRGNVLTNHNSQTTLKTIVLLKPLGELKQIPKIDWVRIAENEQEDKKKF
jgi:hypothetical protein